MSWWQQGTGGGAGGDGQQGTGAGGAPGPAGPPPAAPTPPPRPTDPAFPGQAAPPPTRSPFDPAYSQGGGAQPPAPPPHDPYGAPAGPGPQNPYQQQPPAGYPPNQYGAGPHDQNPYGHAAPGDGGYPAAGYPGGPYGAAPAGPASGEKSGAAKLFGDRRFQAGAVVVAFAAVAFGVAAFMTRSDGGGGGGGGSLPAGPSSEPEELWSEETGSGSLIPIGGLLLVGSSDGDAEVTAFDATSGKELWNESDVGLPYYGFWRVGGLGGSAADPPSDVLFMPVSDEAGIRATDAETGKEVWTAELDGSDARVAWISSAGLVVGVTDDEGEVSTTLLDPGSGEEKWEERVDGYPACPAGGTFVIQDGERASAVSSSGGEDLWRETGSVVNCNDDVAILSEYEEGGSSTKLVEIGSGDVRWDGGDALGSSVYISGDQVIGLSTEFGEDGESEHSIVALNMSDGSDAWQTDLGGPGRIYLTGQGLLVTRDPSAFCSVGTSVGEPIDSDDTTGGSSGGSASDDECPDAAGMQMLAASDGEVVWEAEGSTADLAAQEIDSSRLYATTEDGDEIVAVSLSDGSEIWKLGLDGNVSTVVVGGGKLFTSQYDADSGDSNVVAFG